MALTRITKGVIKPNENYDTHNINSTGIVTAVNANITGDLNVGGVLTYEDVTSIDSVGIITARNDIHVGAGVSAVGVGTFGSLDIGGDIDVDGHTNLDNVNIAGVTTTGGNLFVDGNIEIPSSGKSIKIWTGGTQGIIMNHGGTYGEIDNLTGTMRIKAGQIKLSNRFGNLDMLTCNSFGSVDLFHNNILRFTTTGYGVSTTGLEVVGVSTFTGNIDANGDLDVDGHTNLDNVSIAGVTTMGQTTIFTTGGTTLLLKDSDSTNPADRSGIAFVDQNNTQTAFIGKASASDAVLTINNTNTINPIRLKVNNTTRLEVGNAGVYATGSLSATGTLTAGGTLYIPDEIQHSGDANTKIRFPANDTISFETAGTERLRIKSSGDVAINGTATTDAKLDVRTDSDPSTGVVVLAKNNTAYGNGTFYMCDLNSKGNWSFGMPDNTNAFAIVKGIGNSGTEYLRIASSGKVGINETSPDWALHITEGSENARIKIERTGTSGVAGVIFKNTIREHHIQTNGSNFVLYDNTSNQTRIQIDSSGRIFIGNTQDSSPYSWGLGLQVTGTSTNAGLSIRRDQSGSGGALLMFVKTGGAKNGNTIVSDGDQIGGIYFNAADGTDVNNVAARISAIVDGTPGSNDTPGRLTFSTTADGANSPTERVSITSAGELQVGSAHTTSTNYGWGPVARFQVENANDPSSIHFGQRAGGSADPALVFLRRGGSQSWVHHAARIYYDTEKFNFETAAPVAPGSHSFGKRMVIKHNGKVGIGSDTPNATLDLQSTDTEVLLRLNTKPVKNGYLDIVSDANRRGVIRFQDSLGDGGNYRWSIGNGDSDELTNTSFHISSGNSGGGAAKFVINSAGGVGIGTANITSIKKLDVCDGIISVQAGHTHDTRIEFLRKNTGALGWIGIPNWSAASLYIYGPTATSNEIAAAYGSGAWNFYTGGVSSAPRLTISSTGNFALGTQVDAGNTLRYLDVGNYHTGTSAGSILRLLTTKSDGTGAVGLDIVKYKTGGAYFNNYETIGSNGFIAFSTGQNGGSVTEALRIAANGELSISGPKSGNSIPDVSLKFNILNSNGHSKAATITATKTADISSELIFSTTASHSFDERMRIDSAGRLLLGRQTVSHTSSNMEIYGGGEAYLRISPSTNTGTAGVVFGTADDHSTGGIYYNGSDDSLVFAGHNNDEKLRIASDGNVSHSHANNTVISTTRSSSGVTMAMQAISNPVGRVGTTSNHSTELVAYNNPAITLTGSAEILAVTKSFVSKMADYNQTFNTGGWSTNWNNIINPGSLGYHDTYLISAYWYHNANGGNAGSPYLMQASFLFTSVSVNNTSGGNVEFTPFQTAHVGGGSHRLLFRMIPGGGHTTAGVQVKNAAGFHGSYGAIQVKACRISDF